MSTPKKPKSSKKTPKKGTDHRNAINSIKNVTIPAHLVISVHNFIFDEDIDGKKYNFLAQISYNDGHGNTKEALIDIIKQIKNKAWIQKIKHIMDLFLDHVPEWRCAHTTQGWTWFFERLEDARTGDDEYFAELRITLNVRYNDDPEKYTYIMDLQPDGTNGYRPAELIKDLDKQYLDFAFSPYLPTKGRFKVKFSPTFIYIILSNLRICTCLQMIIMI